eukprot:171638_1
MNIASILVGVGDVMKNVVISKCTLYNDTEYEITIVDYDDTRKLKPHYKQGNGLVAGSIDLILIDHLNDYEEHKINFPASKFEGREHRMSVVFAQILKKIKPQSCQVRKVASHWKLVFSHGGFEMQREYEIEHKCEWRESNSNKITIGISASIPIKGIELSPEFKNKTTLTTVNEFESKKNYKRQEQFGKDPVYIWQEVIIIHTTDGILQIPTPNLQTTEDTLNEPSAKLFVYCKQNK